MSVYGGPWPPEVKQVGGIRDTLRAVSAGNGGRLNKIFRNNTVVPILVTPEHIRDNLATFGTNVNEDGILRSMFKLYNTEQPLRIRDREDRPCDDKFQEPIPFGENEQYKGKTLGEIAEELKAKYRAKCEVVDENGTIDWDNVSIKWFGTWPDVIVRDTGSNRKNIDDPQYMEGPESSGRHPNILKDSLTIWELYTMTHTACSHTRYMIDRYKADPRNESLIQLQTDFYLQDEARITAMHELTENRMGKKDGVRQIPLHFAFYKTDALEEAMENVKDEIYLMTAMENGATAEELANITEKKRIAKQSTKCRVLWRQCYAAREAYKWLKEGKYSTKISKKHRPVTTRTESSDEDEIPNTASTKTEIKGLEGYVEQFTKYMTREEDNKCGPVPTYDMVELNKDGIISDIFKNVQLPPPDPNVAPQGNPVPIDTFFESVRLLMQINAHPFYAQLCKKHHTLQEQRSFLRLISSWWFDANQKKWLTGPERTELKNSVADGSMDTISKDLCSATGEMHNVFKAAIAHMLFTVEICEYDEMEHYGRNSHGRLISGLKHTNKTTYHILKKADGTYCPLIRPTEKNIFSSIVIDPEGANCEWKYAPLPRRVPVAGGDNGPYPRLFDDAYDIVSNQFIIEQNPRKYNPSTDPDRDGIRYESDDDYNNRLREWTAATGRSRLAWKPRQHEPSNAHKSTRCVDAHPVEAFLHEATRAQIESDTCDTPLNLDHDEPGTLSNRRTEDILVNIGVDAGSSSNSTLPGARAPETDHEYTVRLEIWRGLKKIKIEETATTRSTKNAEKKKENPIPCPEHDAIIKELAKYPNLVKNGKCLNPDKKLRRKKDETDEEFKKRKDARKEYFQRFLWWHQMDPNFKDETEPVQQPKAGSSSQHDASGQTTQKEDVNDNDTVLNVPADGQTDGNNQARSKPELQVIPCLPMGDGVEALDIGQHADSFFEGLLYFFEDLRQMYGNAQNMRKKLVEQILRDSEKDYWFPGQTFQDDFFDTKNEYNTRHIQIMNRLSGRNGKNIHSRTPFRPDGFFKYYLAAIKEEDCPIPPNGYLRVYIEKEFLRRRICTYIDDYKNTAGYSYLDEPTPAASFLVKFNGNDPYYMPLVRPDPTARPPARAHIIDTTPSDPNAEYADAHAYALNQPSNGKRKETHDGDQSDNAVRKQRTGMWLGASLEARRIIARTFLAKGVVLTDVDGFVGADALIAELRASPNTR
jgi:hypothetical protein